MEFLWKFPSFIVYPSDASAQKDNFLEVTQKWKLCFWNEFIMREYLCVSYCYEFYWGMTRINAFMQSMWKWQLKMWCFILDDDLSWVKLSSFPTPNPSSYKYIQHKKVRLTFHTQYFRLTASKDSECLPVTNPHTQKFSFLHFVAHQKNYISGFTNIFLPT